MIVFGLIILLPLLVFAGSYGISERLTAGKAESAPSAAPEEAGAPANQEWLSPAAATANGKPILLLFTPYEMCQIRYCPQPELAAERLAQQVGDAVNFVPVTVYAVRETDTSPVVPGYHMDNWDLYPVPPYDAWLPRPQETQFGLGLQAPVFTLVDNRGTVVSQGHDFPDAGRLVHAE
jgi:hypothetical protein